MSDKCRAQTSTTVKDEEREQSLHDGASESISHGLNVESSVFILDRLAVQFKGLQCQLICWSHTHTLVRHIA